MFDEADTFISYVDIIGCEEDAIKTLTDFIDTQCGAASCRFYLVSIVINFSDSVICNCNFLYVLDRVTKEKLEENSVEGGE